MLAWVAHPRRALDGKVTNTRRYLWVLALIVAGGSAFVTRARHPANFDYYVLSLSWSPQYCAVEGGDDARQCGRGRRYGFVLHGLWPQYDEGYPEHCDGDRRVSAGQVERMQDIMPSARLVRHQWARHGTCSGLSQVQYFATAREAYQSVRVPDAYRGERITVQTRAATVRETFLEANDLSRHAIALRCDGRYLAEVRICLDKDLEPRTCGADVRSNCDAGKLIMRPVR
ncbi:MAG: ribonuclease T2 family protein [Chromatiales bacterium]